MFNPLSLLKKKNANENFITIDVGSSSIKVCKFSFLPDKRVLLENITTAEVPENAVKFGRLQDINSFIAPLRSLNLKGENAIFGLSGESVFGFATTAKVKRQNPHEKVNNNELNTIIKQIQELAVMEANQIQAHKLSRSQNEIELVNSGIISAKMDGKLISEIVGSSGIYIEIGLYTSFAEIKTLSNLQELSKKLKINFIAATSQMYALTKVLSIKQGQNLNCVLIDFGGDKTDIGICFGGGIVSTKTLDFGSTIITEKISKELKIPLHDAEAKKISFEEGTIDAERIKEIINKALNSWLLGIESAFENFEGIKVFPPKIYILGGGALIYNLTKVVGESPWYQNFAFKTQPEIELVNFEKTSTIIEDPNNFLKDSRNIIPASIGVVGMEILK